MTELLSRKDDTEDVFCQVVHFIAIEDRKRVTYEYPGYIDIRMGPLTYGFWADDAYALHIKFYGDEGHPPLEILPGPADILCNSVSGIAMFIISAYELRLRPDLSAKDVT